MDQLRGFYTAVVLINSLQQLHLSKFSTKIATLDHFALLQSAYRKMESAFSHFLETMQEQKWKTDHFPLASGSTRLWTL